METPVRVVCRLSWPRLYLFRISVVIRDLLLPIAGVSPDTQINDVADGFLTDAWLSLIHI